MSTGLFRSNINLNKSVTANFKNVKFWYLAPAVLLLASFTIYFIVVSSGQNYTDAYIDMQKELFFSLNNKLAAYPLLQHNLTQFGDVLISFSLLSIFIVYAPKLWEALLTAAGMSLIVSVALKKIFSVPRPAAIFDHDGFTIIGKTLSGHTSLPSGHSIATFVVITILLFAFMPKKTVPKIFWSMLLVILGLVIAFSRVGVGAHYPFDVIIGCAIGYIIAIAGIKASDRIKWLSWVNNEKYYPLIILFFVAFAYFIILKILSTHLMILYLSLFILTLTLLALIKSYAKKT